jgi:hypothetical protein
MNEEHPLVWFRWLVRALAAGIVVMAFSFLIGEGGFHPFLRPADETVLMVLFWAAIAGLVLGWWSEWIGGLVTVGSILLFYLVHQFIAGSFPKGWAFALIALPGLLFLAIAMCFSSRQLGRRSWKGTAP